MVEKSLQSAIKNYWVLNISDRQLFVFREPTKNGYNQKIIFSEHHQLNLLKFPEKFITISQMLRGLN
jgi:Uma2 family endonuclease